MTHMDTAHKQEARPLGAGLSVDTLGQGGTGPVVCDFFRGQGAFSERLSRAAGHRDLHKTVAQCGDTSLFLCGVMGDGGANAKVSVGHHVPSMTHVDTP